MKRAWNLSGIVALMLLASGCANLHNQGCYSPNCSGPQVIGPVDCGGIEVSPCTEPGTVRLRFLPRGLWSHREVQHPQSCGPAVVLSVPPACGCNGPGGGCGGPTPWIPPKFPVFDTAPVVYASPPPAMYAETPRRWPERLREPPVPGEVPLFPSRLPDLEEVSPPMVMPDPIP